MRIPYNLCLIGTGLTTMWMFGFFGSLDREFLVDTGLNLLVANIAYSLGPLFEVTISLLDGEDCRELRGTLWGLGTFVSMAAMVVGTFQCVFSRL